MNQIENLPDTAAADVVAMLRESARDFCARALDRSRLRALRGAAPAFDRARWGEMAELGWTAILVPTARGGLGLEIAAAAAVGRQLGSVAAPEPMIETAIGAATLLACLDAPNELLQPLLSGESILVPALGTVNGDAFANVQAVAGKAYTLNGAISNVALGPDTDGWLIPATLARQPAWFYLASGTAALTVQPHRLSDGSQNAQLVLDGCCGTLLGTGERARHALAMARNRSEVGSSAYLLGLSEALFQITVDYVGTRRQFGQAIGSFQVIQHRMVDLYLQLRLADAVIAESCALVDDPTPNVAQRAASRARYRACSAAQSIAREAVQLHGAIGYTDECDVGLYVNRILVLTARYGPASAHVTRVARLRSVREFDGPADFRFTADAAPPNGNWNAFKDEDFRGIVRQWLEANYPNNLRHAPARLRWHECRDWYTKLYRRGWAAPAWPVALGGMGLNPDKLLIFIEERERWGVGRTPDQGIIMMGPLLMQHGTPAQQAHYLPKALSGEHVWCQGYSEPNAGSDLASLTTSAVREGDEFVINGQKIWTSLAQDANNMFCLVRTDREAKPQAGISFVLIDLAVPGITIRPIRNIAGDEEFCEVFFDNVRIPASNLVGPLNGGWTIAKALLSFERIFVGSPKQCQHALNRLQELAEALSLWSDAAFVDRYTRFALDVADLESLYKEFAGILRRGEVLGPDVSVLKIWASETFARLSECLLDAAGEAGARAGQVDFAGMSIDVLSQYYNARPTPIYGGSNEIQRNILAKQVLRLPSR